jgi:hypothetical protein
MYNYTRLERPVFCVGSLGFLAADQLLLLGKKGGSGRLATLSIGSPRQVTLLTQDPGHTDARLCISEDGKQKPVEHLSSEKTGEWVRQQLVGSNLIRSNLVHQALALRDDWEAADHFSEPGLQTRLENLQQESRRHAVTTMTSNLIHELLV